MEHYVGLDVSLKQTAICIVDQTGKIAREGVVASDPEIIAAFVKSHAPQVARVGLEAGATSTWLWTELNKLGLPVICIDARHAKDALKMQINKSDRNDAVGIARIMQCGWYKEVRVKDLDSHAVKALLVSRALLVKIKRDVENQIRGLLKNLGLVIGRAKMNAIAGRAAELAENRPELGAAVEPLLRARTAIEQQIADLDRKVMLLARNNAQARRFMTAPGVGPVTALCFLATIDDPTRFKRSRCAARSRERGAEHSRGLGARAWAFAMASNWSCSVWEPTRYGCCRRIDKRRIMTASTTNCGTCQTRRLPPALNCSARSSPTSLPTGRRPKSTTPSRSFKANVGDASVTRRLRRKSRRLSSMRLTT
jgi:transposase